MENDSWDGHGPPPVFWNKEAEISLMGQGFFPTRDFLERFKKLTSLLRNQPDAFLIKLKRTGESKKPKKALEEFGLHSSGWKLWDFSSHQLSERKTPLPVVSGDVETVEVKCGKSWKYTLQKDSYIRILREGFLLRLYLVDLVSFEKNEFEIEEKLLTHPHELEALAQRTRRGHKE
jgi:hypothetical protein